MGLESPLKGEGLVGGRLLLFELDGWMGGWVSGWAPQLLLPARITQSAICVFVQFVQNVQAVHNG